MYRRLSPTQVHHARNSPLTPSPESLIFHLYWIIASAHRDTIGHSPLEGLFLVSTCPPEAASFLFSHEGKMPWRNHLCSLSGILLHFLNSLHSGFCLWHSIKTTPMNVSHGLLVSKFKCPSSGLTSLDWSAAFNTVDYNFFLTPFPQVVSRKPLHHNPTPTYFISCSFLCLLCRFLFLLLHLCILEWPRTQSLNIFSLWATFLLRWCYLMTLIQS